MLHQYTIYRVLSNFIYKRLKIKCRDCISLYALLYKFHLLCVLLLVQLSLLTVCFYSRAKATCVVIDYQVLSHANMMKIT